MLRNHRIPKMIFMRHKKTCSENGSEVIVEVRRKKCCSKEEVKRCNDRGSFLGDDPLRLELEKAVSHNNPRPICHRLRPQPLWQIQEKIRESS